MTLFEHSADSQMRREAPLAARMRPRNFDEYAGQEHLVGSGRALRKSIEADQIPSMVLWGPPGSGKTTLANLIATMTRSYFSPVSAVASGVADLRRIVKEARDRLGMQRQRTILFIDELHRFNKAQQDVILPHVESGTVILIGATTENPSFEINSPLLSRSRVFTLQPLSNEQLTDIVRTALQDNERGLGRLSPQMDDETMGGLVEISNGDARTVLNALEMAVLATDPDEDGTRDITAQTIEDATQRFHLYDKAGDQHYDTISAFIKSMRGSDPDAAIYYLARMIEAGEDPLFITRRLVILAAEDVGMADPRALTMAVAAQQAVHLIGMPEGRILLAEATVYLATAPKSNASYMAINKAIEDVQRSPNDPVPKHLRNAVTNLMKDEGYGEGYKYAHDHEGSFTPMQNLPESLKGRRYYDPTDHGYEAQIAERLKRWWGER
ncbi:MAG: replication-associated recombination protein A [SAR202 cluster bacterium]|nr:replication-associated recombination protein A [SAR202 cluster bacterium]